MSESDKPTVVKFKKFLSVFLEELRYPVFPKQAKAAAYFGLAPSTVYRNEHPSEDVASKPPIGYMLSLAKRLVEQWQSEGFEVEEYRQALLQEVNKAVKGYYYPAERPLRTWDELCAIADAYMAERRKTERAALKVAMRNPYITSQAVEVKDMFFGRQQLFDYLCSRLTAQYQDTAIVLYGPPRVGKTSVLKQMHYRAKKSHLCVYLDLKKEAFGSFGGFLWHVADETWRALRAEGLDVGQPLLDEFIRDSDPARSFSEEFVSQLQKVLHGRRLLLMFDELAAIWDAIRADQLEEDFFVQLSGVLRHQASVNYLFCTEHPPREVSRELAQAFPAPHFMETEFLQLDDITDLANKPVAGHYRCSPPACEQIHEITAGHPYFAQAICRRLFERWQEQEKDLVDERDIEAVLSDVIDLTRSFLEKTWDGLTADEKTVVRVLAELHTERKVSSRPAIEEALAAYPEAPAPGQIAMALERLAESRVIYRYEPYRFSVDVFRAWIFGRKKAAEIPVELAHRAGVARRLIDEQPDEWRRLYLRHVRESCTWLDFRGLVGTAELSDLRLTDIYVPLHVTVARSQALFQMLTLRAWARVLAEEAAASPEPQISLGLQKELADAMRLLAATIDRPRVEAVEAARQNSRLVILGDPGSGKSTFLRYLALMLAGGNNVIQERPESNEQLVPILLPIDAYARALKDEPELSLTEYLPRYFAHRELDLPELSTYIRYELAAGRCMVLLDGLDTVLDRAQRVQVARHVESFISRHEEAGNRFVVTSRIEGYREAPLVGNYLHCTVSELEMQEIEQFAHQWSLTCELRFGNTAERRNWAEVQAVRLIEAIKWTPSVRRLAGNPLLLTMIALIHRQGRMPQRRFELYEECARTLVERWNQHRALSNLPVGLPMDAAEAFRNFGPLALWMHETQKRGTVSGEELENRLREEIAARGYPEEEARKVAHAFLELERNQVGLLVERGLNIYGFSHLTFQEYFAAFAVAGALSSGESTLHDVAKGIRAHLHDPRWREVILLTLAQIGKPRYTGSTFLLESIAGNNSAFEPILHRDLLLAARVLADDVAVSPQVRDRLLDRLLGLWRTASFDRLRREITSILASMHGTASQAQVIEALRTGLADDKAEIRQSAADALGQMGKISEEVLDTLSATLRSDPRPKVRAHAAMALSRLNVAPDRIATVLNERLKQDPDQEVRLRAAEALTYIGRENPEALALLLEALSDKKDGNVRGSAAAALAGLQTPQESLVDGLLSALQDSRLDVRTHAAEVLGRLGERSERVVDGLLWALSEPRPMAQISAAMALGQVGDTSKRVVQALIERLGDDDYLVRSNAAAALGKLAAEDEDVVKALEKRILHDPGTAVGAVLSLGRAGRADLKLAQILEVHLKGDKWQNRVEAAAALSSHDKDGQVSETVVGTLAEILTEERRMGEDLQTGMAITLSEVAKRGEQSLRLVLQQLEHPSWVVRAAAAEALGLADVSTVEVVNALASKLVRDAEGEPTEPHDHVRGNAAAALGALGLVDDEVVGLLVAAVDDRGGYVRLAAADALGKLDVRGRQDVLDALKGRLDDDFYSPYHDKHVQDAAFEALWVLAPYSTIDSTGWT